MANLGISFISRSGSGLRDRIARLFGAGIHTLTLGSIIPDLQQLDLLASKIMPQIKSAMQS